MADDATLIVTESAVVETATGKVRGEIFRGVSIYRGIPYGASTSGANRFRPPQPPTPWAGVRETVRYGETAPQAEGGLSEGGYPGNRPAIGEDCLVLNVWTPAPDTARRPVMVWLHGGGFEAGSGSSMLYDGVNLCRRGDVVCVSINHRLGLFGHCDVADRLGEEFAGSVNAGFLDIVAALRWVRENIDRFGGDPDNITIYGQSGGGRKVSIAMASKDAAGLFRRGIVQSGSHLRLLTSGAAHDLVDRLLKIVGLTDARTLQALPMEQLLKANRAVQRETGSRFAPAIDGHVFEAHPWDPAAPVISAQVPMMVGTCRTELSNQLGNADESLFSLTEAELPQRLGRYLPPTDAPELIEVFRRAEPTASPSALFFKITTARGYWLDSVIQTERKAAQGVAPVWSYRLMWRTPIEGGRRITPHSLDLPFMFDNVSKARRMVGEASSDTEALANAMSEAWLAFARTGDPNCPAIPDWAPYDLERRPVMLFDVGPEVASDPHRDERLAMARYPTQQMGGRLLQSQ
ncbi:MAG TPA: carboxylesterase family protein [Caulobacteraceae bacterium]|nr:carboxylesterase family protein [Caulobacteraceae bacterium]